jgi:hypothetical protein
MAVAVARHIYLAVVGVVSENGSRRAAVALEDGGDTFGSAACDVGHLGSGGLARLEELELAVFVAHVDAVERECVQVHVESERPR